MKHIDERREEIKALRERAQKLAQAVRRQQMRAERIAAKERTLKVSQELIYEKVAEKYGMTAQQLRKIIRAGTTRRKKTEETA